MPCTNALLSISDTLVTAERPTEGRSLSRYLDQLYRLAQFVKVFVRVHLLCDALAGMTGKPLYAHLICTGAVQQGNEGMTAIVRRVYRRDPAMLQGGLHGLTEYAGIDRLAASRSEQVEKVLTGLNYKQNQAIRLHFYDGLNQTEAAARMETTRDSYRALFGGALRKLRRPENWEKLSDFIDLRTNFYRTGSAERQTSPVEENVILREELLSAHSWDPFW